VIALARAGIAVRRALIAATTSCKALCCFGDCRTVSEWVNDLCDRPQTSANGCPAAPSVWVCDDALYPDGTPVHGGHTSDARIVYSGLCYRLGGDLSKRGIPRDSLPPGTNVLETNDFGKAVDCHDPQCGSDRAFIKATTCSGQDLEGATVTEVWVCATLVAECGCNTIAVGRSTNEPWICWQVNPGPAVDEDEIPTGPTIRKIVDGYCNPLNPDGSREHTGCCECVSGCAPVEFQTLQCDSNYQLQRTGPILKCCCNGDDYTIDLTSFAHSYSFTPHPPQDVGQANSSSSVVIQNGHLVVTGGSIDLALSRPTIVRVTGNDGTVQDVNLGLPLQSGCGASPYELPRGPEFAGAAWISNERVCSQDERNEFGDGFTSDVSVVWNCAQRTYSITQRYYQYGGFLRIVQTWSIGYTRTQVDARCTGDCAQGSRTAPRAVLSDLTVRQLLYELRSRALV